MEVRDMDTGTAYMKINFTSFCRKAAISADPEIVNIKMSMDSNM